MSLSEEVSSPFLFFCSVFFAIFKPPRTRPGLQPLTGCAARSLEFVMDRHRRLGFPSRSPLQLAAHVPLGVFRMPGAFCWQAEGENGTPPRTVDDTNGSPVRLDNHFRYRQAHGCLARDTLHSFLDRISRRYARFPLLRSPAPGPRR